MATSSPFPHAVLDPASRNRLDSGLRRDDGATPGDGTLDKDCGGVAGRPGSGRGGARPAGRSGLTLALALLLAAAGACGGGDNSPVASAALVNLPADHVVYGMIHHMTRDGVRQALLRADTAYLYEDSATARMMGVRMNVYDEQGTERAVVTAQGGWIDYRIEQMMAWGDVVVVSQDEARRIETEELHYDPRGGRIWSTVATTLREGGRTIRGSGFESDGQLRNIRVTDARSEGVIRF